MPKQVTDIKQFLLVARRKDAREVRIKKDKKKKQTKFKVRCSRFLYTLVMPNDDKVQKLRDSLPTGLFPSQAQLSAKTKHTKQPAMHRTGLEVKEI